MPDLPTKSKTTLYVILVVVLCVLVAIFVVAITLVRPDKDNTSLITTILGVVSPVLIALLAAGLRENALAVDGRLTQLLILTETAARAEGKLAGQTEPSPGEGVKREEARAAGVESERTRAEGHNEGR